jgi:hypothetical protein
MKKITERIENKISILEQFDTAKENVRKLKAMLNVAKEEKDLKAVDNMALKTMNYHSSLYNEKGYTKLDGSRFMTTNFNLGKNDKTFALDAEELLSKIKKEVKKGACSVEYSQGLYGEPLSFFKAEDAVRGMAKDLNDLTLFPAALSGKVKKTSKESLNFNTTSVDVNANVLKSIRFNKKANGSLVDNPITKKIEAVINSFDGKSAFSVRLSGSKILLKEKGYQRTIKCEVPNIAPYFVTIAGNRVKMLEDITTGNIYGGNVRAEIGGARTFMDAEGAFLYSIYKWIEDNINGHGAYKGLTSLAPQTIRDEEDEKVMALNYVCHK